MLLNKAPQLPLMPKNNQASYQNIFASTQKICFEILFLFISYKIIEQSFRCDNLYQLQVHAFSPHYSYATVPKDIILSSYKNTKSFRLESFDLIRCHYKEENNDNDIPQSFFNSTASIISKNDVTSHQSSESLILSFFNTGRDELLPEGNNYDTSSSNKFKTRIADSYKQVDKFTIRKLAPPLQRTLLPAPNSTYFVTSPLVLSQNDFECNSFICGPLPITYTNNPKTVEKWLQDHVNKSHKHDDYTCIGVDIESVPTVPWIRAKDSHVGPATIQLSTPYSALVIQLTSRGHILNTRTNSKIANDCCCCSPVLKAFLSDPTILKVGAGIDEDMIELHRWNSNLRVNSRFDLGGIGLRPSSSKRIGLKRLTRSILGVELPKSKSIVLSDWSRIPLSDAQVFYASRDAWAAAAIVENLNLICPRDKWNINQIGRMIQENENDIRLLSKRAKRRRKAKAELKDIVKQYQLYSSKIHHEPERKLALPELVREEIDRLQNVMKKMNPGGVIYFDSDSLGLDFTFDTE